MTGVFLRFSVALAALSSAAFAADKPNALLPPRLPLSTAELMLAPLFERPVIAGASISYGVNTVSPSMRAATRFVDERVVAQYASPGRTSLKQAPLISDAALAGRSILLAIDLMFWDSFFPIPRLSMNELDALLIRAERAKVPVVLGDVPALKPRFQTGRLRLNEHIRKVCVPSRKCYVLPFDALYEKLLRDGGIDIGGRKLSRTEILPDGLHLSDESAEFIAGMIFEALQKR